MTKMRKLVFILTHSYFNDRRSDVMFTETVIKNPDPDAEQGSCIRVGFAEDVPAEMVRAYYLGHRNYIVEGYTDEELYPDGVPEAVLEAREGPVEATEEEDGADVGEEAQEAPEDVPESQANPLAGIDFDTDNAAELAATFNLSADDFHGITPSGSEGGFLTKDVRLANKNRKS
jgi:hypothetical protein